MAGPSRFSFKNLFEPAVPPPVVQVQQVPANNQQQPAQSTGSAQMDVAAQNQQQNNSRGENKGAAKETSPLDSFADFWDTGTPDTSSGNTSTGTQQNTQQQPSNQQQQIQNRDSSPDFAKIAKNIDFSRVLNRDQVTKALGGDADSFMAVINSAVQAATAASMRAAHQMNAKSGKDMQASILASLPSEFKKMSLLDTKSPNAALNHPAMRPIVDSVRMQMAVKYPDATTEELQEKAEAYVTTAFGEVAKGGTKKSKGQGDGSENTNTGNQNFDARNDQIQKQRTGEFNWDDYLSPPVEQNVEL